MWMEIAIDCVDFLLFVGLIISPIILLKKVTKSNIKYRFAAYLALGLFVQAILLFIFAYWSYSSDIILLNHFGYDFDGMTENEFYGKVSPENIATVKSLEGSIMGIGWQLKAILTFEFFSPYLLIVYSLNFLINKIKRKGNLNFQTN